MTPADYRPTKIQRAWAYFDTSPSFEVSKHVDLVSQHCVTAARQIKFGGRDTNDKDKPWRAQETENKSPRRTLSRSQVTGTVSSSYLWVNLTGRRPRWFTWEVPVFPKKVGARDPCRRSELKFDFILAGASSLKYVLASMLHKTLGFGFYACFPPFLLSILQSLSNLVLSSNVVINNYIHRFCRKTGY